jgi:hypothetical protein
MEPLRVRWVGTEDGKEVLIETEWTGWVVDTDIGLTNQMMKRIIDYTLNVQKDRLKNMASGPMRDSLASAVIYLEKGRVKQNLTQEKTDKVLWDAYTKEQSDRSIFIP